MKNTLTSIIINITGRASGLKQCLKGIEKFTNKGKYEIIIIDNNNFSNDIEGLNQQKKIRYVDNKENNISRAYQQAVKTATGTEILFLDSNIIVTPNWLSNLLEALYSDLNIAAVTPVTNNCGNNQALDTGNKGLLEMHRFAEQYNLSTDRIWQEKVVIFGYCMLIKSDIINKLNVFDSDLYSKEFFDINFSLLLKNAEYKILQCNNTFVCNIDSNRYMEQEENNISKFYDCKKVITEWGIDRFYFMPCLYKFIINELADKNVDAVLEIGCQTGALLQEINNTYPYISTYGIEKNIKSVQLTGKFLNVNNIDIENSQIPYEENMFDYIILSDTIMEWRDPEKILTKICKYLKPTGQIIISFYNIAYYKNIEDILMGKWRYKENKYDSSSYNLDLLQKKYIKYFTLKSMRRIIENEQLKINKYERLVENNFVESAYKKFIKLYGNANILSYNDAKEFRTYKYILSISK